MKINLFHVQNYSFCLRKSSSFRARRGLISFGATVLPLVVAITTLPANAQEFVKYQCAQGKTFEVKMLRDEATMRVDNQSFKLLPVDAREGLKYSNGRTLLKVVGNTALVEVDYQTVMDGCVGDKEIFLSNDSNQYTP